MTDLYKITTPAAETPVTLQEAKDFLRVDNTADDTIITRSINAAVKKGEGYTNRVFVQRTFQGLYDTYESSLCEVSPFVQIRRSPIVSVSAIEVSISGSFSVVSDAIFKEQSGFSRVLFPTGITGQDTDVAYPLRITFVAGYGDVADVPDDISLAILEHVAFLYENRGDSAPESKKGIPVEVKALYSDYRILNTYG